MIATVRSLRCCRCLCLLLRTSSDYYMSPCSSTHHHHHQQQQRKKKLPVYKLTNRIRGPQQVKPLLFHANVTGHHLPSLFHPGGLTQPPSCIFLLFFFCLYAHVQVLHHLRLLFSSSSSPFNSSLILLNILDLLPDVKFNQAGRQAVAFRQQLATTLRSILGRIAFFCFCADRLLFFLSFFFFSFFLPSICSERYFLIYPRFDFVLLVLFLFVPLLLLLLPFFS